MIFAPFWKIISEAKIVRARGSQNVYLTHFKKLEDEVSVFLKDFSVSDEDINCLKNLPKGNMRIN